MSLARLYPATDGADAETHSQTLVELGEHCGRGWGKTMGARKTNNTNRKPTELIKLGS